MAADAAAAAGRGAGPPGIERDSVPGIRAALLPEEVAVFDAEFRQAMAEATEALDLAPVQDFLRRWRRIAAATTADPTAHRRMLGLAADADAGRPLPAGEPWEAVKARLGL